MTERKLVSGLEELDKVFKMTEQKLEDMKGIAGAKLPLPKAGETIIVRFLPIEDKSGGVSLVEEVRNPKFRGGVAYFHHVETVENPGITRIMSLDTSLYYSERRIVEEEGIELNGLIGKIAAITGTLWTAAPVSKRIDASGKGRTCTKCGGKGCSHCTVTGAGEDAGKVTGMEPPTVHSAQLRKDLMGVGVSKETTGVMKF